MCSPPATPRPRWSAIWSAEEKIRAERRLWLAVLDRPARPRASPCPTAWSRRTRRLLDQVDLASIAARERVTRHDVKARIEEFAALAGHEHIHKAMTSRDLTENVEQLQIRASAGAGPGPDGGRAGPAGRAGDGVRARWSWSAGRTTCRPRRPRSASGSPPRPRSCCSPTTGSATCSSAIRCGASRARSAPRQTSSTCSATRRKVAELERAVARHLGFARVLTSVGQVYPRSLDFDVRVRAGPGRGRTVLAGHHDPADGRARSWSPRASSPGRSARRPCRTR